MMGKAQFIIVDTAKDLAKCYYEIGKQTWESVTKKAVEKNEALLSKSIVGNTNMAFACEIILKMFAISEGKNMNDIENKHNLEKLFQLLSQERQENIIMQAVSIYNSKTSNGEYSKEQFYKDIQNYKDTFVECRYWYEVPKAGMPGKKARQLFIYSFATSLIMNCN